LASTFGGKVLIMKRITASLIIACLLLGATAFGQQITFSNKKATIKDISKVLEKQAGISLITTSATNSVIRPTPVHVKNVSVQQFLDAFFKDQPFRYEIYGKMVTIVPRETSTATAPHLVTIRGKIVNEQGEPIPAATILVNGSNKYTTTDDNGEFTLNGVDTNFNIVISSVNYEPQELNWQGEPELDIRLKHRISELNIVSVVSNGYQKQTQAKATGSYAKLDNELLNRRVSTSILERLEGVTSGLVFNKNINPNTNQSTISVRGRSTIFANPNPLIVLDNFPYTGDINNINPNDVESITVLKDAESASIWGAFSGNGVIVITTKKGKYEQPLKLSFNSNVTVGKKPDQYYLPLLGSREFIDLEELLYDRGFYDDQIASAFKPVLSPAVEIFVKRENGQLSAAEADAQLSLLRNQDKRDDLNKYVYRNSVNQQYSVNASGGGNNNHYYFSAGYDRNLPNLRHNDYNRLTLTANNTVLWFNKNFELNTGIIFTETNQHANNNGNINLYYPYLKLADAYGNPLSVPSDVRQAYKDTAGGGKLLDWNYRPLEEFKLNDNHSKQTDYRINVDAKLKIVKGLEASAIYQYNRGFAEVNDFKSQQTYYTRNLINQYTDVKDNGQLIYNIPLGGILDQLTNDYQAHNVRTQLNFNKSWFNNSHTKNHALIAIAGAEVRSFETQLENMRLYGYNKELQTSTDVNYDSAYPVYYAPALTQKIPFSNLRRSEVDRFVSYYLNAKYIFQRKYILSASARKDESNLFGVEANQKGVPLWSVGAAWEMSQETFYHVSWLPFLKLRVTNGYNGNVDKTVSAFTTAFKEGLNNFWGAPIGYIINPPNPSLRWEKNHMINFGVDFATKNGVLEGSLEYYIRKGTDLIGNSPLDPTTGVTQFRGNTADMKGHGYDLVLRSKNLNKQVKWQSTLLFSYTTNEVTDYKVRQAAIWYYCDPEYMSPVEGRPLYSIFSFKFMGLDPNNGGPITRLNGDTSTMYSALYGSNNLDNLVYNGPATPTSFGSFRNTISWKQLELSFNITWKLGYYFRRSTVQYYNLFLNLENHNDFGKRWQKPGDENFTTVPSMIYPADQSRDAVYAYSDAVVEKGDHIRLQDLQLSYDFVKNTTNPKQPFKSFRLYVYANNLGIIWRANDKGIDPDFVNTIPNARTISFGARFDF
jgi:TonB-linked outer membrane protein, SusC/RagA family